MSIFADQRACWQPHAAPATVLPTRALRASGTRTRAQLSDERLFPQQGLLMCAPQAGTTPLCEPDTTGGPRPPRLGGRTRRLAAVPPQDLARTDLASTGDLVTVSGQLRTERFRRYLVIFGNTVAPCATADPPEPPRRPGRPRNARPATPRPATAWSGGPRD
jgi:hypothetical protein